jgi:hypothetical protein
VQPADPVGYRGGHADGRDRQQATDADLGDGGVVGGPHGRGGELGVAKGHLRGDVPEQRHQRRQADAAVDQTCPEGVPENMGGDVQRGSRTPDIEAG